MSRLEPFAVIGILILLASSAAAGMLIIAHVIGPRRHGPVKDSAYESGVPVVHDTRRRFSVRFYMVAMLFLLFDVEVVFMWPWATAFYDAAVNGVAIPLAEGGFAGKEFLLTGMVFFFLVLVFGLVYEWKKGAFEWD